MIFEPLDFIARLAGLVLKQRVNLTPFHGVFASNNKYRVRVTPAKPGRGDQDGTWEEPDKPAPATRSASVFEAPDLKPISSSNMEGKAASMRGLGVRSRSTSSRPRVGRRRPLRVQIV